MITSGHQSSDHQNDHQRVVELRQEAEQWAFTLFRGQHVKAQTLLAVLNFEYIQSLLDVAVQ